MEIQDVTKAEIADIKLSVVADMKNDDLVEIILGSLPFANVETFRERLSLLGRKTLQKLVYQERKVCCSQGY